MPQDLSHDLYDVQFDGIMRGSENCQPVDGPGHLRSDSCALYELIATVHDAMADDIDLGSIRDDAGLAAPQRYDRWHELFPQMIDGYLALQEGARSRPHSDVGGAAQVRPVHLKIPKRRKRIVGRDLAG